MPLTLAYGVAHVAPRTEGAPSQDMAPDGQRGSGEVPGATVITDDVLTDTAWTLAGSPYQIRGDRPGAPIAVAASATLTIEAGVVVTVTGVLNVFGKLVINGAPDARVSVYLREGPSYDHLATASGIILNGVSAIRNADFYSVSLSGPYVPMASLFNPDVSLDRVYFTGGSIGLSKGSLRLTNSVLAGAWVAAPAGVVSSTLVWIGGGVALGEGTITLSSILGNNGGVAAGSGVTVTENNIYGNYRGTKMGPLRDFCARSFAITNVGAPCGAGGPFTLKAPNNWWGTTDTARIGTLVSPNVDFLPIATGPIADAPRLYAAYLPWVNNGAGGW